MRKRARVSDFKVNMQICRVYSKIARNLETINKKQDKNDQKVFRDKNFIQRNAEFVIRSKNVRISCVYETHAIRPLFTSFHDQKIVQCNAGMILKTVVRSPDQ